MNEKNHLAIAATTLVVLLLGVSVFTIIDYAPIADSLPPTSSQTAAVSDFNSNLVAHYTFDDGSAIDASGKGNNGMVNGASLVTGKVGSGALSFDGDDYVSIGTLGSFGASNGQAQMQQGVTISAWVKTTNSSNIMTVLGNGAPGISPGLALSLNANPYGGITAGDIFTSWRQTSNWGSSFLVNAHNTINDGLWHHVVAVVKLTGTQQIWIDGVSKNISSITDGFSGYQSWSITPGLGVGADISASGSISNYFNGSIDDVRIYNTTLSSSQIQELYVLGSGGTSQPDPEPDPEPESPQPTVINGSCGSTNNSCTAGTSSDTSDSSTNYLWQCVGSNGGSTASCSVVKPTDPAPTGILRVKKDGTGNFTTIQSCVDAVNPAGGDTCLISAGTYYETVGISKPVKLVAEVQGTAIIDGSELLTGAIWTVHSGSIYKTQLTKEANVFIADGQPLNPKQYLANLNGPGQYFMDVSSKILYAWLPNSTNPASHTLRVSSRDLGIGTAWNMGSNIEIDGLVIRYVNRTGINDQVPNHSNLVIRNTRISWSGMWGIYLRTGANDRIENTIVEHTAHYEAPSIVLYNMRDTLLQNSTIRHSRCDLMQVISSERITIRGNLLHNNLYGSDCHPDLLQLANADGDIRNNGHLIEGNTMYDGETLGIMASFTDNVILRNNKIYNTNGNAVVFAYQHTNLKLHNNTILGRLQLEGSQNSPFVGLELYNNTIQLAQYGPYVTGLVADYNIYMTQINTHGYAFNMHYSATSQYSPMSLEDFRAATGQELHGKKVATFADLKFVDLANFDLHLQVTSPMINTGVTVPGYSTDIEGTSRPQGSAWDIGAYEYTGTTQPPPPPAKPGDLNNDNAVNSLDFSLLASKWNQNYPDYDLNSDGIINSLDFSVMAQNWSI